MSNHLISIVLLGFCIGGILAWSQQPHITISKQIRTRHQRMILLSSNDDDTDKEGENKLFQDNTKEESSFGVSYIGGGKIHMFILSMHIMCSFSYLLISLPQLFSKDPCGSKYNDDPFDVADNFKPGLPDNMKDRIAELANQKAAKEEKEKSGR